MGLGDAEITGMLGVYLTAAELSWLNFIASPTSRSAFGADLLVTDQKCKKAWSVQVKTNRKAASFWLVNAHTRDSASDSHVYVFVNLKGDSALNISLCQARWSLASTKLTRRRPARSFMRFIGRTCRNIPRLGQRCSVPQRRLTRPKRPSTTSLRRRAGTAGGADEIRARPPADAPDD